MKPSSRPPGTPSGLPDSVHHQLNLYALAASAAGVGVLALAQPAEAKIVYTKTHQVIGANGIYHLDLNHDGIIDFVILEFQGPVSATNRLRVKEPLGNAAEGSHTGHYNTSWAAALNWGSRIGPSRTFVASSKFGAIMARKGCGSTTYGLSHWTSGQWVNVSKRYLGLKFKIHRKNHYGWARMSVSVNVQRQCGTQITATLTGYAYETIPGKSIKAGQTKGMDEPTNEDFGLDASLTNPIPNTPQPATLGALAMGAPGLSIWRREELVGARQ